MRRKVLLAVATLIAIAFFALPSLIERAYNGVSPPSHFPTARAKNLHATLRVADLHADALLWGRDLKSRSSIGHVDLPRLREGGVVLQGFGLVTKVPRGATDDNDGDSDSIRMLSIADRWPPRTWSNLLERALYQAGRLGELERDDRRFMILRQRKDVATLLQRHKSDPAVLGGVLGLEGAHALGNDLGAVDRLYDAGLRSVGLAHFFDNEWAGSAHGRRKGGLSAEGRALITKLEAKKIVIDLAHASPQTIDEVLRIAKRPVMVSHTGVAATCRGPRNLTDAQLRAVAKNGGLIGIGYWPVAICGSDPAAIARAIAHAVGVAGPDHVALGSDFDGAVTTPFDAAGLVFVTDSLLSAGMDEATIKKVMGENAIAFWGKNLP